MATPRLLPNFSLAEVRCKCGRCSSTGTEISSELMDELQRLRDAYGKPITITSGYRCARHPVEIGKAELGEHTQGLAVDIAVRGADAVQLLRLAMQLGFTRFGISQKGASRFIHLGIARPGGRLPSPAIWSY